MEPGAPRLPFPAGPGESGHMPKPFPETNNHRLGGDGHAWAPSPREGPAAAPQLCQSAPSPHTPSPQPPKAPRVHGRGSQPQAAPRAGTPRSQPERAKSTPQTRTPRCHPGAPQSALTTPILSTHPARTPQPRRCSPNPPGGDPPPSPAAAGAGAAAWGGTANFGAPKSPWPGSGQAGTPKTRRIPRFSPIPARPERPRGSSGRGRNPPG